MRFWMYVVIAVAVVGMHARHKRMRADEINVSTSTGKKVTVLVADSQPRKTFMDRLRERRKAASSPVVMVPAVLTLPASTPEPERAPVKAPVKVRITQ